QFAIDWAPHEKHDLDLYVYAADGSLAGRSVGIASTSEAVRVQNAANGRYRVVVVPQLVDGTVAYQGFVEVERAPAVSPVRPLLPNMVTLPVRNPTLRTGAYFIDHEQQGTPSCYPEEVAERGARRCLRFDQVIANTGEGPFELRYRMEGVATEQQLRQRIYASDGTFEEFTVDTYEFHATHAHFHYKNFGQAFLYRLHADGRMEKVRESKKNGFCMIDVENSRFGVDSDGVPYKGEAPRTYSFPRCNAPTERDEHGTYMVNGISPGWADVYNWFLADQYIEISGVPDGVYVIETVANPIRTVHETTYDDNVARATIRLHGDTVTRIGDDVRPMER
ncbi:MAG TPA: lysyl oxidase family protein, partial [Acidimicrobiia bacterium]|nr:lysyl oxidase family protein [Acidimicrobiia bacterium]